MEIAHDRLQRVQLAWLRRGQGGDEPGDGVAGGPRGRRRQHGERGRERREERHCRTVGGVDAAAAGRPMPCSTPMMAATITDCANRWNREIAAKTKPIWTAEV